MPLLTYSNFEIEVQSLESQSCKLTIKDLMSAGAHFGHQTRRWNPKMKLYIFEEKNGLYIINLAKTLQQLRNALPHIRKVIQDNKTVLFVGTKKQAKCVIREAAIEAGEFFIAERWLGGMLTNMTTIRNSIKTLDKIEKDLSRNQAYLTKKEAALLAKRHQKLLRNLEGIRYMKKAPGLLVVVDPSYEKIAVAEAKKLGIPVLALVDTNCDPTPIDHVIPCNDDSLKSIRLIINVIKENIIEAKHKLGIEIVSPVKSLEVPDLSAFESSQDDESDEENREEDLLAKKFDGEAN
ncbi:30S ribosomal protein S2 [Chlamydia pneumoniae]|uniref:Small ribosomal subunit protein uS2 n=1 Tax=Chlamydia pneumoniae TaxID=83558 RepID=A0A0F7WLX6_CHLPN|nr:30S ribosomal protein S2 [Chlamydia pneumoniae]CRI36078.1 30S ribosomal protein S2 [Chlamydia pneumoniae]CRI37205.1 30S ribosomal protein S2 [Chlamydia pneumoniae]CRI38333.1 30S ribosomal protein S2 [Chlamydia pneumoniae]CRI39465.1 30S ribosomal protein S2 [Chlamydia pneumoniae]